MSYRDLIRVFRPRLIVIGIGVLYATLGAVPAAAVEPDWSAYDKLLEKYVSRGTIAGIELNRVDYDRLRGDPELARVVADLAAFRIDRLASREEILAFYINTYNILALKMVVDNWPLEGIGEVGNVFRSVWKRPAGTIGGQTLSLDDIEHKRLRKMNDPRIHMAIVCASVSCPDLRMEAYRSERLSLQLDEQCAAFLRNPRKGLRLVGDRAEVSKIFEWFAEDFAADGGVLTFIRHYYPLPESATLDPSIEYNWSLNKR